MFDLFSNCKGEFPLQIIQEDGLVDYYGIVLSSQQCTDYFELLFEEIEWRADQAVICGKHIYTQRKVAWYGDREFEYSYSNTTKTALPWTAALLDLKSIVEHATNETYNSCLLNLYHSGAEGMAWHSDAERDLKKDAAIASLSLGATRTFAFKHKQSLRKVHITLETGSLLVMKNQTQKHWLHRLPPTKKVLQPRINLTFRTISMQ